MLRYYAVPPSRVMSTDGLYVELACKPSTTGNECPLLIDAYADHLSPVHSYVTVLSATYTCPVVGLIGNVIIILFIVVVWYFIRH